MSYNPTIVAHRGLHADCPENSLTAFRRAKLAGVPWVECDVWPSGDVHPLVVVIHDGTLDRTTTLRGPVGGVDWDSLRNARLRDADGRVHPDEGVAQLSQVIVEMSGYLTDFEESAPHNVVSAVVGTLIEIKPPDARSFVRSILSSLAGLDALWMIQSFDEANLIHCLTYDIQTPVALLVEDRESLDRGIANGWKNIHVRYDLLDRTTATQLRDAGTSIGVWTVNTRADLARVMELGADWIITDEPLLAQNMLGELRRPH